MPKKLKGGPFGLSLPWPDLASGAQVVSGLFLKSGPISVRIGLKKKKQAGNGPSRRQSKAQKQQKDFQVFLFTVPEKPKS